MNSRERVLATAERRKTDRVPTSMRCTPEVMQALQKHLQLPSAQAVYDALDIDLRWISLPFIGPPERSTPPLGGEGYDFWGVYNKKSENPYNTYYEFTGHPLAECRSAADVYNYPGWPDLDWWDYDAVPGLIDAVCQKDERAILFFAGGTFETPWYMRGMEQFFMDLVLDPEIADAICTKVGEYYLGRAMRVLDKAKGRIDVIGSGGDIGGQEAMMVNPDVWRQVIKPHSTRLIRTFKDMGLKTFYHSDGAIVPVIQDFVEMGLDILDPIQVGAAGMSPENIYDRFGDRLSFHGAIDEVELLPHATPDEVYRETQRVISILGQNNGYIVSPTHALQGDTPVANILAIYQAARDYR